MKFTFITEDGSFVLDHASYLESPVCGMVNDQSRLLLNLGRTIVTFDRKYLSEHKDKYDMFYTLKTMQEENPLQFWAPSCLKTTAIPDFLNDTESDMKILTAPNRIGKTSTGVVDVILEAVPTSPKWPIFAKHGIRHRPFRKPIACGFATSDWTIAQRVLWPEIRKWIPRRELGEYDPRNKDHKDIAWRINPSITLACGTTFYFFCYEQAQGSVEGMALNIFYWDEQGERSKFDGVDERLRTLKGRHVFGLTPHKVEGRPDTGAKGYIAQFIRDAKMNGGKAAGHKLAHYKAALEDVPDWVYPESEKKKAIEKWITIPTRMNDVKTLREGMARVLGEFHETGGLVFDEFDDRYHLIDPFDIPDGWTRYRSVDHGTVNPCACLWLAVSPDGDYYIYREYYRPGLQVSENARNIVEASGNELEGRGLAEAGKGVFYERYIEKPTRELYHKTIMDSRSGATKSGVGMLDYAQLYDWSGLKTTPAPGLKSQDSVPVVKEMLRILPDKKHPYNNVSGSPRVFVFRNLSNFQKEIMAYSYQEFSSSKTEMKANQKEVPVGKDDHLMTAFIYICAAAPRYIKGTWAFYNKKQEVTEEDEEEYDRRREYRFTRRDSITGY